MGKIKIGIGVITCNREAFFQKCINSIPGVDEIIVINDGKPFQNVMFPSYIKNIINHKKNVGVGRSKNEALEYLIKNGCTEIFLCEDDIIIKDENVFDKYILASELSGILHFNFAYHGFENRDEYQIPTYRKIVKFDSINISLNKNILGALSYYKDVVIKKVGGMDKRYYNGIEHVDHTFQIIKSGFHPPFWWFADIENSYNYIVDQDIDHKNSTTRFTLKNKLRSRINNYIFYKKFGFYPSQIPDVSYEEVLSNLKSIKNRNL